MPRPFGLAPAVHSLEALPQRLGSLCMLLLKTVDADIRRHPARRSAGRALNRGRRCVLQ